VGIAPKLILVVVAGAIGLAGSVAPRAAAASRPPAEIVYVAGSGPVYGYNATSRGRVAPIREADPPNDPNAFWDPWSLALDRSGNLYVQSFLSDATTFVFAPNPQRGVAPIRTFQLYGPDTQGIAVDENGYEYVLSGDTCCFLAIGPPRAAGRAAADYYVEPLLTTYVGFAYPPWPQALAIAPDGREPVVVVRDSVATYYGGPAGTPNPIRALKGSRTGLTGQLGLTISPRTNLLYVTSNTGTKATHISEFGNHTSGNVRPIRVIGGPATGLSGRVITGIAVSPRTGRIYAMVKQSQFGGPARIEVFSRLAHGDASPIATFTDRSGAFSNAEGLAIAG
jgi:hypothetical protein